MSRRGCSQCRALAALFLLLVSLRLAGPPAAAATPFGSVFPERTVAGGASELTSWQSWHSWLAAQWTRISHLAPSWTSAPPTSRARPEKSSMIDPNGVIGTGGNGGGTGVITLPPRNP